MHRMFCNENNLPRREVVARNDPVGKIEVATQASWHTDTRMDYCQDATQASWHTDGVVSRCQRKHRLVSLVVGHQRGNPREKVV